MSTENEIIDNIKKKYPDILKDIGIQKEHRLFLRNDKENREDLSFNFLVMYCVYFLGTSIYIVAFAPESLSVESVTSLWPTVNRPLRETLLLNFLLKNKR
ncbi:MAG: hypothetical protein ACE5KE_14575 [Methanosarcinales archaeon]